jgi:L-alanine-DL-glutamate epimerase-like enolase superfamily enzyme
LSSTALSTAEGPALEDVRAAAYTIPCDALESDGTLTWDSTTVVVVEVAAGDVEGIGWTYAPAGVAGLVDQLLVPALEGAAAFDIGAAHAAMRAALRNAGQTGAGAMALSAADVALWDLKAKLLGLSLATLLGPVRREVPLYGSGGFCSYTLTELAAQLEGWAHAGIPRVKMKVGRDPGADLERVRVARRAIGPDTELYVDANGAFSPKQALLVAERYAEDDVRWFEEPVSSLDLHGLRLLRDRGPAGMDIAAGEYAATLGDFEALAGAVDCLQADATRCGGITGFLAAAAIAAANELDLSGHTAPTIHAHALCAVPAARHLEWFHDHVRIERMLFDGFLEPDEGSLRPDPSRPGLGVELRRVDAEAFAAR